MVSVVLSLWIASPVNGIKNLFGGVCHGSFNGLGTAIHRYEWLGHGAPRRSLAPSEPVNFPNNSPRRQYPSQRINRIHCLWNKSDMNLPSITSDWNKNKPRLPSLFHWTFHSILSSAKMELWSTVFKQTLIDSFWNWIEKISTHSWNGFISNIDLSSAAIWLRCLRYSVPPRLFCLMAGRLLSLFPANR